MKKFSEIMLLSILIFTFASCRIDESVGHCIQTTTVLLNWVQTQPIVEEGNPVTITILPSEYYPDGQTFHSDIHGPEAELNVGKHTVVAYETSDNAHVDPAKQTVNIDAAPDGNVTSEPDYFSAGSTTIEITPQTDANIILPLYKQVRKLMVELKFEGAGSPLVTAITGNLDGIAVERAINHGFKPVDPAITRPPAIKTGNIDYTFTPVEGQTDVLFTGNRKLLGIDGNGLQTLELDITFSNAKVYSLTEDVTSLMDGFHTEDLDVVGGDKPWYIKLTYSVDAQLNISLTDWDDGGESGIIAE